MELENAIQIALDGDAVLLTGSGFSYGAKNIKKDIDSGEFKFIPLGDGLKNLLLDELGMSDTDNSLEDIAGYYISQRGTQPLINQLRKEFTVSEVADYHRELMKINWRRVFTTNYDTVAERAASEIGKNYRSVSLDDEFTDSKTDVCIHINGIIDKLDDNTLNRQFKLTNRSYSAESLLDNQWFDFMIGNLRCARVIFIIGFSMKYDLDIRRVISGLNDASKVIFITAKNLNPIEKISLSDYGDVYNIGIECLAEIIRHISESYTPKASPDHRFTSFKYFHGKDPITKRAPQLKDILMFYTCGNIWDGIFEKAADGLGKYVVFRKQIDTVINNLYKIKAFIVSSYLGNGKTVFCYELIEELKCLGKDVFYLSDETVDLSDDVENICKIGRVCIVIIDDFYKHYNVLKEFKAYGCKNVTFVLTGRIVKEENNIRKVKNNLGLEMSDIKSVYLNTLSNEECDELASIIKQEDITPAELADKDIDEISKYLREDCKGRIADIVLKLYESSQIRTELEKLYNSAIMSDNRLKKLTITTLANTVMSLGLSMYDITAIHSIDFVVARSTAPELFDELFGTDNSGAQLKSSVVAKEILYNIVSSEDVVEVLIMIAKYAERHRHMHKNFNEVMKALISHYNFSGGKKYKLETSYVYKFYDELRHFEFYKGNPFFWEQYALACMDANDFITARQCITNAYSEGKKRKGFVPFQICTTQASLIISEKIFKVSAYKTFDNEIIEDVCETIVNAKDLLLKYYDHPENNRAYVFTITRSFLRLYDLVKHSYGEREQSIYIQSLVALKNKLDEYLLSDEGKNVYYLSSIKTELEDSIKEAKDYMKKEKKAI